MPYISVAARRLAAAGWPVFPVDAVSKRPRNRHGHLEATTNQNQVRDWWQLFDNGGAIGTPTGNGLLVIDVDPRNGGSRPTWAPPTRTARTQSGGWHLHYKVDEDIVSRAGLFGAGVDSKSRGGYVLLPPSPGYVWEDLRARTVLSGAFLEGRMVGPGPSGYGGAARLAPERWARGIIHDQVVAWAAYFAGELDEDEVAPAVWNMVDQARAAGVGIDNNRGHIDSAIRWVLSREGAKSGDISPGLS